MTMEPDEILADLRRHREAHAAKFDFDVRRIAEDMDQKARAAGIVNVSLPPRRPEPLPERKPA